MKTTKIYLDKNFNEIKTNKNLKQKDYKYILTIKENNLENIYSNINKENFELEKLQKEYFLTNNKNKNKIILNEKPKLNKNIFKYNEKLLRIKTKDNEIITRKSLLVKYILK